MKRKTNISVQDNRGIRVTPNLIVGEKFNGYVSGDILDANSVADLVKGSEDVDVDIREVKYNELVSLRNSNKLVPGCKYRITDYVTTTTQENTQSAGHAFDIIVLATDTNVLNENALATKHNGDTYFANSNLAAWELKYSLDNDTNKFEWADSTNGKGVIYYMKDEFNNECPYDFKNIQYIKTAGFVYLQYNYKSIFGRIDSYDKIIDGVTYYAFYRISYTPGPPPPEYLYSTTLTLSTSMSLYKINGETVTSYTTGNIFSTDNSSFVSFTFDFNNTDASLKITQNVYNNIIKPYIINDQYKLNYNIFRSGQNPASFNLKAFNNIFEINCTNNILSYNCYNNKFEDSCIDCVLNHDCHDNKFGGGCKDNTFGVDNCFNSFGNVCRENSFASYCYRNSFGNNCNYNSFGNACNDNSLGNLCNNINFQKEYISYCIVENSNQYINVTSTATTSSRSPLRNITIAQGVNNTSTVKTISHNTVNDTFKTTYQPADSQVISV